MIAIFLATYGAVLLAELVGDKLLYTTGVLATRYRVAPMFAGITAAFMAKMGAAVALGRVISKLPPYLVGAITTASCAGVAVALWRKPVVVASGGKADAAGKTAMISFGAIFCSEWGDVGQITAAAMAARFGSPLVVWIGAVAAVVTKGALATSVGAVVRGWASAHVPPAALRYGGVGMLLLVGLLSTLEALGR